jgi:Undecaprenyl-phosphate galactose phosphotransferase WbaP
VVFEHTHVTASSTEGESLDLMNAANAHYMQWASRGAEHQWSGSQVGTIEAVPSYDLMWEQPHSSTHVTKRVPADLFLYRVVKRSTDMILMALMLPVLVPVFLVVMGLVLLSSQGPVFYSHRRIHRNGAFFSMWKFRTMCVDSAQVLDEYLAKHPEARTEWNNKHKLLNDPRVTKYGSILRQYSLDELPQLWNVLRGEMTLVGPRPIVAAEVEKYGDCFSCYCSVKPGLTGLWQISGRSLLTYRERVALDCKYVQQWSLWSDFVILIKTIRAALKQHGAV